MAEVSAEKLVARLASGKPVPAIVLIGSDAYLSDLCRKQIIEACVPEARARMGSSANSRRCPGLG